MSEPRPTYGVPMDEYDANGKLPDLGAACGVDTRELDTEFLPCAEDGLFVYGSPANNAALADHDAEILAEANKRIAALEKANEALGQQLAHKEYHRQKWQMDYETLAVRLDTANYWRGTWKRTAKHLMQERNEWREEAIEALTDEVEQNCGEGHMDDGTPLFCDMALSRYEYAIRKLCELGIMRLYGEQPQRYCFVDKGVTVAK